MRPNRFLLRPRLRWGGAYSAPTVLPAGFKGSYLYGRGREMEGKAEGEGREGDEMEEEGAN